MTSDSWLKLCINFVCLPRETGKARALEITLVHAAFIPRSTEPVFVFTYVWHDSFVCGTWLIHTCDMTHSHVTRSRTWLDLSTYVWHDSFVCAKSLFDIYDVIYSHLWRDSFIFVAWLIHICDMTRSRAWLDLFTYRPCHLHSTHQVADQTNRCHGHKLRGSLSTQHNSCVNKQKKSQKRNWNQNSTAEARAVSRVTFSPFFLWVVSRCKKRRQLVHGGKILHPWDIHWWFSTKALLSRLYAFLLVIGQSLGL